MKVCKKCGRELDESCFYRNKRMKDGLQLYCKPCFDEMQRATKARHKKSVGTGTGDRGVLTAPPHCPSRFAPNLFQSQISRIFTA